MYINITSHPFPLMMPHCTSIVPSPKAESWNCYMGISSPFYLTILLIRSTMKTSKQSSFILLVGIVESAGTNSYIKNVNTTDRTLLLAGATHQLEVVSLCMNHEKPSEKLSLILKVYTIIFNTLFSNIVCYI